VKMRDLLKDCTGLASVFWGCSVVEASISWRESFGGRLLSLAEVVLDGFSSVAELIVFLCEKTRLFDVREQN